MGFNVGRMLTLEWAPGTDLAGAVIRMKATPIAAVLEIEEERTISQATELFVQYVAGWNLIYTDEDGQEQPIPITVEGALAHLERAMLLEFMRQWHKAAIGLTAPLVLDSGDGEPSPEEEPEELSIPMEPLSPLPVS